jgi:hypothetical protein
MPINTVAYPNLPVSPSFIFTPEEFVNLRKVIREYQKVLEQIRSRL